MAPLAHPNIIKLIDFGVDEQPTIKPCLVLEYAENGSLDRWLHGTLIQTVLVTRKCE